MKPYKLFTSLFTIFCALGFMMFFLKKAQAQNVAHDNTIGSARRLRGPEYSILQEDGLTVGQNLFHSFRRFGLDSGETARFQSSHNIRNIFSRVTGRSRSVINGSIFANDHGVNFYLINPQGIIFGPNAQLNIGSANRGSFVATTVDALVWSDGNQFNARNSDNSGQLMTLVGDPSGFLAGLQSPGPLHVRESQLALETGQNLILMGGEVEVQGKEPTGDGLTVFGGQVGVLGIGAQRQPEQIEFNIRRNPFQLFVPANITRADVLLAPTMQINASLIVDDGNNGGNILILGDSIRMRDTNLLVSGNSSEIRLDALDSIVLTDGTSLSAFSQKIELPSRILLNARNSIEVSHRTNISADAFLGPPGNIRIETDGIFSLLQNAALTAATSSLNEAGRITVRASEGVFITNSTITSGSASLPGSDVLGDGGNISIQSREIYLDQATLSTLSTGIAGAGDIQFNISDLFILRRNSQITTEAGTNEVGGGGDGGNIFIEAGLIVGVPLEDNDIVANAFDGSGGRIDITTRGIFGLQERNSEIGNGTNDIDASSRFGDPGRVVFKLLEVDPSQSLTDLPDEVVEVSALIDQNVCQATEGSEFVTTGRGGIPPNPSDILSDESIWEDRRLTYVDGEPENFEELEEVAIAPYNASESYFPKNELAYTTESEQSSERVIEAHGWIVNSEGAIELVASASSVFPGHNSLGCG